MAIVETLTMKIALLIFLLRLPCKPCFKFSKEPQSPVIVVLGHNTTNVNMEWKFETEGRSIANLKIKRFLKNQDGSLSNDTNLVYFSPSLNLWNGTLYTFSASSSASGYANFTIKDVLKRIDNADKTKVSFLSGEVYTYRLDVDTVLPSFQSVTERSNIVDLHVYALSLSFTRKPGDPLIVVLNSNSSNVEFRWDFSLANGETLQYFNFRRHEKDKDRVLSRVTIGGTFSIPNATLYNMDTNINPGPSSGYIRFTIKDIMKQIDNKDGSEANPLSIDYMYSLWIKTSTSNDETFSYIELKVLVPPKIIFFCQGCQSGDSLENKTITLFCNATGKPMPNVTWMKNGEYFKGSSSVSSSNNMVVFPKFSLSNSGNYACVATNGIGNPERKTIALFVDYKPQNTSIKISADKSVFCEGESIRVRCTSQAKPAPVYFFYLNNVSIGTNSIGVFVAQVPKKGNYNYTCVPKNSVGVGELKSEQITVKEPPKITDCLINDSVSANKPVNEGDAVTVACRTTGSPPLTGKWTKDGRIWNELNFNSINREDAGTYKFNVNNGDECQNAQKDIFLSVYYLDDLEVIGSSNKSYFQSSPVVLFNLSMNANPSNTTTLSCRSSANTLAAITSHDAGLYTKHYMVFVLIKSTVGTGSIVCRAKHDAGVRERTLHFYERPTLFKTPFSGQFIITNQVWQDELKDAKSAVYDDLAKKCIKIIKTAYSNFPYLADVNIKEFLKGSIKVLFQLEVIGQVSDPLLPLRDYIKRQGGEIDGLQIDYNSIQKSSDVKDDSPVQTEEQQNKTVVVVLAVLFALAVFLNMIFIAIFIWLRRKDSKGVFGKRSKSREEIVGQMNDIALQETSFNATENRPADGPIGRRGLVASNSGIPEYEAVSRRTQPAQSLNNNPMPQYEGADRHRLPGVDSNTPSVTYQTVQPRTGDYGSLSPSTRLPPKDTVLAPTGNPKRTGEYEALHHKSVSPQYQSLDDLSRC